MAQTNTFNPFMKWLLRSPLHILVSKRILLITFTGHKSGKSYTTPVNYVRIGNVLNTVSQRNRTWWKNLRAGAQASVRLRGRDLKATGEVVEDYESVTKQLLEYLQVVPHYTRYFRVGLDPDGRPKPEDVAHAAKDRVVIRLRLNE